MKKDKTQNKYFIYARKLNEAEDRQVQSLPAQIRVMKEIAQKRGFNVIDIIEEAKSAKAPGRSKFDAMLSRIQKGEANGILCWHINRLARNPIDGGRIIWILQEGTLQHICSSEGNYYPQTNAVIMHVELGVANEYVRALSRDTKRGICERAERRGYPNGLAPTGYLNDLTREAGDRGWIIDKKRCELVKKLLKLYLTGAYSVSSLTRTAHSEYNLTTPVHKTLGGKLISHTQVWNLLKNPVYAGFFYDKSSKRYELNKEVPRMISEEEYWRIQDMLGKKGRSRSQKRFNEYSDVATCDHCECNLVLDVKNHLVCSECKKKFSYKNKDCCPQCKIKISKMNNPTIRHYRLLHCTKSKRKKGIICPAKSVQINVFDKYMADFAENDFGMSDALSQWCIDNIGLLQNKDLEDKKLKRESNEEAGTKVKRQMVRLVEVRMATEDPTPEQEEAFVTKEKELKEELLRLQKDSKTHTPARNWFDVAKQKFNLAAEIKDVFINGTEKEKREVLLTLGSNLRLNEKNISIINTKSVQSIVDGLKRVKVKNSEFEPKNCTAEDMILLEKNTPKPTSLYIQTNKQKTAISNGFLPTSTSYFSSEFSEANASEELSGNVRPDQDLTTSGILLRGQDSNL